LKAIRPSGIHHGEPYVRLPTCAMMVRPEPSLAATSMSLWAAVPVAKAIRRPSAEEAGAQFQLALGVVRRVMPPGRSRRKRSLPPRLLPLTSTSDPEEPGGTGGGASGEVVGATAGSAVATAGGATAGGGTAVGSVRVGVRSDAGAGEIVAVAADDEGGGGAIALDVGAGDGESAAGGAVVDETGVAVATGP
jgi:hypothetical protein